MSKKVRIVYEVDPAEFGTFEAEDGSTVDLTTVSDTDLENMVRDRWGHDLSIFMRLVEVTRHDGRKLGVKSS